MNKRSTKQVSQRRIFWSVIALALTLAFSGLGRSAAAQQPSPQAQKSAEDAARRKGDLIGDELAAPKARPEVFAYPSEKTLEAVLDAAAYADDQLSRIKESTSMVNELLTNYQYNFKYQEQIGDDDAKTLFAPKIAGIGVGKGIGLGVDARMKKGSQSADDDPCEFKIVVLQALFESDLQRGIAVANDWLKSGSSQTVRCKGAALTLLARHAGKSATPIILGVAKNETDLKLRTKAISVLGATNDESVIDALRDFALNSTVTDISEAALYALSQHNSERAMGVLGEIATSNRPVPLRRAAIASISNRPGEPAVDLLLKIYDTDRNLEIRRSAINGLSRRKSERAASKLMEIARGADNAELRRAAIYGIARRSGDQSVDILLGFYESEKDEEVREQILGSLAGINDPRVTRKLIAIAKDPKTPIERRKRAIGWLSRSKDPEVLAFLEDLLKQ
jgi:HEAT repeat protein